MKLKFVGKPDILVSLDQIPSFKVFWLLSYTHFMIDATIIDSISHHKIYMKMIIHFGIFSQKK